LEILEDRTVPATYRLLSGILLISNQTGALTITSTSGTAVQVQDGAGPVVKFNGVGSVYVTGTNLANAITFDDNTPFNGNLFVNAGNGNDTVTLTGVALLGNVTVLGGLGNDNVALNDSGSTIGGNVLLADSKGNDTLTLNGAVLGSTTVSGVNEIDIGVEAAFFLAGNVSIVNFDGFGTTVTVDGSVDGVDAGAFGKNFSVTSGPTADLVQFFSASVVGGNATFNLGEGANTLFARSGNEGGNGAQFNENLTFTGGSGVDTFDTDSPIAVGGNLTLNLGDGNNVTFFGQPFTVAGNMYVNAGNGDNDMNSGEEFFGGQIAGNLSFRLGNGNNRVTLGEGATVGGDVNYTLGNGNNTLADSAGTFIGGTLRLRAGNGNNSYTANRAALYVLDMHFGNGDDSFTYGGGGATLTGLLDGGGRLTANSFTQGAAVLAPTLTLMNFP
jgi:hypothetical protein